MKVEKSKIVISTVIVIVAVAALSGLWYPAVPTANTLTWQAWIMIHYTIHAFSNSSLTAQTIFPVCGNQVPNTYTTTWAVTYNTTPIYHSFTSAYAGPLGCGAVTEFTIISGLTTAYTTGITATPFITSWTPGVISTITSTSIVLYTSTGQTPGYAAVGLNQNQFSILAVSLGIVIVAVVLYLAKKIISR